MYRVGLQRKEIVGDIPRGVNRPGVNPAGLGGLFEVPLTLGGSPATRLDLAVHDSLVIRQAGQRSDKTRWPNGRFMEGRIMLWWAGLREKA